MSTIEYLTDNVDQSISLANQLIQMARDNGVDYWAIDGLVRLGNAYLTRRDNARAEPPVQEALRRASEGGNQRLLAFAELTLASIRDQQGKPADTIEDAQKALDFYKPAGFFTESISALTLIVRSERDQAKFKQALSRAQEELDMVKKMNNPASLVQPEELVGSILLDLEQYPDALTHFQASLAAARNVNQAVEYQLLHCANALWRLGRYADAESMLETIPGDFAARPQIKPLMHLAKARILLSRGQFEGALQEARFGLTDGTNLPPETAAAMEVVAGTAAAQSGAVQAAKSFCGDAGHKAEEAMNPAAAAEAQLCQANASLAAGDSRDAQAQAASAVKFFSDSGQHESEWRSLLCVSRINKAAGDRTAAQKSASEALEIIAHDERDWGSSFQTYALRPDVRAARGELAEFNRNKERDQK